MSLQLVFVLEVELGAVEFAEGVEESERAAGDVDSKLGRAERLLQQPRAQKLQFSSF